MILKKEIIGRYVKIRSVIEGDSEFIIKLRNDPDISKYLPQLNVTLEQQTQWISKQRDDNDSLYCLMENLSGEPLGTISVYDIKDNVGEVGRFCSYGNPFSNIEGCIILYDYCFTMLKLEKVKIWVYEDNKPVITLNHSLGYNWIGSEIAADGRKCKKGEMTYPLYREKRESIVKKMKLNESYF